MAIIKKNWHWIVFGGFITLMLFICHYVITVGDDFNYSLHYIKSVDDFLEFQIFHYNRANGRAMVHFFLTLLLKLNINVWRLINPFMIAGILLLIAKTFTRKTEDFRIALVICCITVLGFGKEFSSFTTLWITGSFNYVYPAFLLFGLANLLNRSYSSKKFTFLLPIIGLLAGATMEQFGAMALGFSVLIPAAYYMKKRKPKAIHYLTVVTTFLGLLSVLIAPGNRIRMGKSTKPVLENFVAMTTMFLNIKSLLFVTFLLVISFSYWLITLKMEHKIIKLFNILIVIGLFGGYSVTAFILYNNMGIGFHTYILISMIWRLYDLLMFGCMIYVPFLIYIKTKNVSIPILMILSVGALVILLAASVSEYRVLMPSIFTLMPFIFLTAIDYKNKTSQTKKPLYKMLTAAIAVISVIFCLTVYGSVFSGYRANYFVNEENIKRIEEFKQNPTADNTLYMIPVADKESAGYSFNLREKYSKETGWVEGWCDVFKSFYGLKDVNVVLEE